MDAVVHLAGAGVADKRWTRARREIILSSRVDGTRSIAEAIAGSETPPVLVSASAIGIYGDRGDERLGEESASGDGFLAEVCRAWEDAAEPARRAGARVVHARFGIVLHPAGGALKKMLLPFRAGVGGRLGNGRQYMSWVSLDDAVRALVFALDSPGIEGPMNVVSPNPESNRDFTRMLGGVLGRPTLIPAPAAALRATFGEMADETMLAGAKVMPDALLAAGFCFDHPQLDGALRAMLAD